MYDWVDGAAEKLDEALELLAQGHPGPLEYELTLTISIPPEDLARVDAALEELGQELGYGPSWN